ncbi:NADH-quinone oxidoreductase subunit H, partial [bacterium]
MIAPCMSLVVALSAYAVIPVGQHPYEVAGQKIEPWVSNINLGVLY